MTDHENLKKLLALSDDELRKKVTEAALAAGADKGQTDSALRDVKKLRGMLSSVTEEQMKALLAGLDEKRAEEIRKRLRSM